MFSLHLPVVSKKISDRIGFEQGKIQKDNQEGKTQMDGPNKGGVQDQPGGDGYLKKTPDYGNCWNDMPAGSGWPSVNTFFLFGHSPCEFQPFIDVRFFNFAHAIHLIHK